jgi:hypothetical protein
MNKSKIVPGISKFNFDYRVVRIIVRDKDGNVRVVDGKMDCYYAIYEIWFGGDGEIVTYCTKPETPYGDTTDELKFEVKEYLAALKKPILDFEFVKDQQRRSQRRMRRRYKEEKIPESKWEQSIQNMAEIREGKAETVTVENAFTALGIRTPDIQYISFEDACEKFGLLQYKEIDGNDAWFNKSE